MSTSSNLSKIKRYLSVAKQEDVKLAKGVKSSAAKLRGALLEIGKECSECRKVVLDLGKKIEVKKRVPTEAKEEKKAEELPLVAPALERQDGSEDVEPAESSPISLAPVKNPRAPRKKAAPAAVVADA